MSMDERDQHIVQIVTDRFERRLAEESGKLRVEMAEGFGGLRAEMAGLRGDLRSEIGALRAEMIERNHELLKWAFVSWASLVGAIAALLAFT